MRVAAFDFELPEELIAQRPPAERGGSRLLVLDRVTGAVADRRFRDLPDQLRAGDLLIVNDSRVLPARLYGVRAGEGAGRGKPGREDETPRGESELRPGGQRPSGLIEVLLTRPRGVAGAENEWEALVRPGRKVRVGEVLRFATLEAPERTLLEAEVVGGGEYGERVLRFRPVEDFEGVVERIGHLPLPPYIDRQRGAEDLAEDRERYQTVYAERRGARERSAAAPTAGLHFDHAMLKTLRGRGVEIETVTLHVGLGTFQPVRVEETEEIRLHAERYTLPEATAEGINRARAEGRRVIAVGTTTTRTLEHCALEAERAGRRGVAAGAGETALFLSPGHRFRVVSGLVTNFHLPQSTLLMLVCALAGKDAVLAAYAHAVRERYRFFSYGDAMLVV